MDTLGMTEFLVVYDYGQGGVWAVVLAKSSSAITEKFPELRVVEQRPSWMSDEKFQRLKAEALDLASPAGLLEDIMRMRESA